MTAAVTQEITDEKMLETIRNHYNIFDKKDSLVLTPRKDYGVFSTRYAEVLFDAYPGHYMIDVEISINESGVYKTFSMVYYKH